VVGCSVSKGLALTEIPEHLLKRSKSARAAAGGGDSGDSSAPSSSTPVAAAAAAPAVRAAAPAPIIKAEMVKPIPAVVRAAKERKRIPIWAMPVVAGLPIWGLLYFQAIKAPKVEVTGPLAEGAAVYNKCVSCHGADGGGGVGYGFVNNSLWQTFPTIEDQIRFVYQGTKGVRGLPYGAADRPGGQRIGGAKGAMPNWGQKSGGELTDPELVAVICHERQSLGLPSIPALKLAAEKELAAWCSPEGKKWLEMEEKGLEKMGVDITAANA
jgi:mono/diheme cytochrome c family protein